MATANLEARLAAFSEAEMSRLRAEMEGVRQSGDPWIEDVRGAFANDPAFLEAMRLGREYRESQRPKPKKVKKARRT